MKTSFKKMPKCQLELEVELTTEEFNYFINQAILDLGKNLEIKGFRKGKVPREIIEEKVGRNTILQKGAQKAVEQNYQKAILKEKLEPITKPEITILKLAEGNPFVFRAKTAILPEINLPDYEKIARLVEKKEVLVNDQEIEDSLNFLQKSRAKFTALLGPAKIGDFIEIEYQGQGIEKIKDAFILGEGKFLPGFEEEIIGMAGGQEKEFSLIFPKDSSRKYLAGKKVDFKAKMISVQKMELPELNDEFAHSLGNFANFHDLKKNVEEGLKKEKELAEVQRRRAAILEKISENSQFEVPETLIESEKNEMLQNLKQKISQDLKTSFENYLSAVNLSEESLKETFLKEAEKKVRNFLILREIGKKEKISVSDDETEQELNKVIKNYSPENLQKLDFSKLKEYIKSVVYNEKVFQVVEKFS